jgi:putative type IV pilin
MKHTNKKKGFTLVELVIVIAVIAILAGVMIATFSNVVDKANKSADLQEVKSSLDAGITTSSPRASCRLFCR